MSDENEVKEEKASKAEKEDNGLDLDATQMDIKDLGSIIDNTMAFAERAAKDCIEVGYGASYLKAVESLCVLTSDMLGGRLREFGRTNGWVLKNKDKWLEEAAGDSTRVTRQAVIDLLRMEERTFVNVSKLGSFFLNLCTKDLIKYSFVIIRFHEEMQNLASASEYNKIIFGFNEYNTLRLRYDVAGIYDELSVSKDYPKEENFKIILKHIDDSIGNTKYFCELVSGAGKNKLYVLDRITSAFRYVIKAEDDMKAALEEAKQFSAMCEKYMEEYNNNYGKVYFMALSQPVIWIKYFLEKAIKLIDDYKSNATTAPYAIMHYDMVVKDVASRWLMESLPDPFTSGTQYEDLIPKMIKTLTDQARVLVKYIK